MTENRDQTMDREESSGIENENVRWCDIYIIEQAAGQDDSHISIPF